MCLALIQPPRFPPTHFSQFIYFMGGGEQNGNVVIPQLRSASKKVSKELKECWLRLTFQLKIQTPQESKKSPGCVDFHSFKKVNKQITLQRCGGKFGNETVAAKSSVISWVHPVEKCKDCAGPNQAKQFAKRNTLGLGKAREEIKVKITLINFLIPFHWATLDLSKHM